MTRISLANPKFAGLAAVLLALLAVSHLAFVAVQDVRLVRSASALQEPSGTQVHPQNGPSIGDLIAAQLFGRSGAPAQSPQPVAEEAPETRLSLELKGVFSSNLDDSSAALIAEKGKPAKYYRLGDRLPGGATLDRVVASHVELRRNGRLERLSFSPPGTVAPDRQDQPARLDQPVILSGPSDSDDGQLPASEGGARRVESLRERLRQLREAQQQQQEQP